MTELDRNSTLALLIEAAAGEEEHHRSLSVAAAALCACFVGAACVSDVMSHCGEKQTRGSGGSLEPPGPLLTHLHTVHIAYSECLPTRVNPLAERTCCSQVLKKRVAVAAFDGSSDSSSSDSDPEWQSTEVENNGKSCVVQ